MTTDIHIDNQAGLRHAELAGRLQTITDRCAPEVAGAVGMELPSALTIRLLTPRTWRTRVIGNMRERVAAEVRDLAPDTSAAKKANQQVGVQRLSLRLVWMLLGPRTVRLADGTNEIWFAPDSARHAGLYDNEDELTLGFAHELIHPAQQLYAPLLATVDTPFPHQRGWAGRAVAPFIEGHATWGGMQIATKILGHTPHEDGKIPQGRSLQSRFWGKLFSPMRKARYEDPLTFFDQVIEGTDADPGLGIERFNGVWADIECFPTAEEMSNPRQWLLRVRPTLAATDPATRLGDQR
ncbi:hypothetical protein GCM10010400_30540 [Streptomyces aculeolatus]|uniref:hypothetical protein n=1 Tax=Streptomyces aculeolatus TaxID=270689 RepID=UPI001CECD2CE|nr:hypothetical protein [Streptomyces aculeolatus]